MGTHGQSVSVTVLNFCSNVYIGQDIGSVACAPVKRYTCKWVQTLSKFSNKNIVAHFINMNNINMKTDQLDMKLREKTDTLKVL